MANTAAELAVELQTDMATIQAYVMNLVNTGQLDNLLSVCVQYGVTASMLGEIAAWPATAYSEAQVHAFFEMNGKDSSGIASPGPAVVESVSSSTVPEGSSASFVVELAAETQGVCTADVSLAGTADLSDLSGYHLSHGVTLEGMTLKIPAGVSSFTVTLMMAEDAEVEGEEELSLTVGGITGTATVLDTTEPPAEEGTPMMPSDLADWAPLMRLNGNSDSLSTADLQAAVIAQTNSDDYWQLFESDGYIGAEDGTFTNAEVGWQLGDQPATLATMESVFYGTVIHALRAVDTSEKLEIQTYAVVNAGALHSGDEEAFAGLIDVLTAAFSDSASAETRAFTDAQIREEIIDATVDLVAVAEFSPSIFHAMLSWLEV